MHFCFLASIICGCFQRRVIGTPTIFDLPGRSRIRKADRFNPHEHITHIGGRNADGSRRLLTDDDAIGRIKQRTWNFYVHVGRTINVIVARSKKGMST